MQVEQRSKLMWHMGELPDGDGFYLLTIKDGNKRRTVVSRYDAKKGQFICRGATVLAWSTLPRPYGDKVIDTRPHWQWNKGTSEFRFYGSQSRKDNT